MFSLCKYCIYKIFAIYLYGNGRYEETMKRVVIYARVSTTGQDYQRQLSELRGYASRMGYEIVKEFSETISGAKKVVEREALADMLKFVEENEVDKVLIYECSRLSRRAVDFLLSD